MHYQENKELIKGKNYSSAVVLSILLMTIAFLMNVLIDIAVQGIVIVIHPVECRLQLVCQ